MLRNLATETVERAGTLTLSALFLGALAGMLGALALGAPPAYALAVPALGGLVAGAVAAARHALTSLTVVLSSAVLLLSMEEGVQVGEIAFFLLFACYIAGWYGSRLLTLAPPLITGAGDGLMAALFLGIAVGAVLGVVFGAPLSGVVADVLSLSMLALYFPIKEACVRYRRGPVVVAGIAVALALASVYLNVMHARALILNATQMWQIVGFRAAGNEVLILFPTVAVLALLATVRGRRPMLLTAVLFCVLFAGLIATKSRGYWVAWAVGAAAVVALADREGRRKLATRALSSFGSLTLAALLIMGSLAWALLAGSLDRIATLATAFTDDPSMLNRYAENAGVMARIRVNPLLGYGLGTQYRYYSILGEGTQDWSYIHNGYLALWFKLGLWGLILTLSLWARAVWCGVRAAQSRALPRTERALAAGATAGLVGTVVTFYTSSPFFTQNAVLATTIAIGFVCGMYQRGLLAGAAAAEASRRA